jgi:MoaA/NifB/PqqE/SkfB family radical SAM enzyme
MKIKDSSSFKLLESEAYNFVFRKEDGLFLRWGKTEEDDPQYSPFGPEIADIEISKDGCSHACPYCYKENTDSPPVNMTTKTFGQILDHLGPQLTQVALGITGVKANPDLIPIMQLCRIKGVVPNLTLADYDLDDDIAADLGKLAGAIAVSYHDDQDACFKTVDKLLAFDTKQVNIHAVTTSYDSIMDLMEGIHNYRKTVDEFPWHPPFKLNALVLLSLKPKGRAKDMENISEDELAKIVFAAKTLNIPLGFDSCSAPKVMKLYPPEQQVFIEPCESGLFSIYINVYGEVSPCSFIEKELVFPAAMSILKKDFLRDIWMGNSMIEWRKWLLSGDRSCPLFFRKGV